MCAALAPLKGFHESLPAAVRLRPGCVEVLRAASANFEPLFRIPLLAIAPVRMCVQPPQLFLSIRRTRLRLLAARCRAVLQQLRVGRLPLQPAAIPPVRVRILPPSALPTDAAPQCALPAVLARRRWTRLAPSFGGVQPPAVRSVREGNSPPRAVPTSARLAPLPAAQPVPIQQPGA